MVPEIFAPGIVSTINHEHSRLVFSKDGNEMCWIVIPVDTLYKKHHGRQFKANDQNIFFFILFRISITQCTQKNDDFKTIFDQ